jgi:hypothetical protein
VGVDAHGPGAVDERLRRRPAVAALPVLDATDSREGGDSAALEIESPDSTIADVRDEQATLAVEEAIVRLDVMMPVAASILRMAALRRSTT